MIKHLLTITLRNMTKQKVRSIISILCITAGLLCFSVCHYYSTIMSRGNKFWTPMNAWQSFGAKQSQHVHRIQS